MVCARMYSRHTAAGSGKVTNAYDRLMSISLVLMLAAETYCELYTSPLTYNADVVCFFAVSELP